MSRPTFLGGGAPALKLQHDVTIGEEHSRCHIGLHSGSCDAYIILRTSAFNTPDLREDRTTYIIIKVGANSL